MKFSEHLKHLSAHITVEWQSQYINYEEMTSMLYTALETAPSDNVEQVKMHYLEFDETFFAYCIKELKKINIFYAEKLAEASRKFASLQSELIKSRTYTRKPRIGVESVTSLPHRKMEELKITFSEFYLSLILLQTYQILNYMGFRKIMKKHDRLLQLQSGAMWRAEHLETSYFHTNQDIYWLISETESSFANVVEGGDRQKAMKKLRVPPLGEKRSWATTFKVGLFSGSFIVLLVTVILSASLHVGTGENFKTALKLYRGPLLLAEFIFLIGMNVHFWRSAGVNHVLIFELDPRKHLSEQHLVEIAAVFGVIWALSVLCSSLSIPPYANPLALVVTMVVFIINPFKIFRHEARFWFLRITGSILAAPFLPVIFAQFWLADQWNSFAVGFLDLHFLICFYSVGGEWFDATKETVAFETTRWFIISRAFVNILPAWARFWQCLRRYRDCTDNYPGHLVNAAKYSTTFLVVMFATLRTLHSDKYPNPYQNPFLYAWFTSQLISSLFSYLWDVKMDWGLFNCRPQPEHKFLRDDIVYSVKFYYFAVVENFLLRFLWIVSFILTENHLASGETMTSISGSLEVFRRFIWNFFRLENEHLFNCGKYRAVEDITLAPIATAERESIMRLMDRSDTVISQTDLRRLSGIGDRTVKRKPKVHFHDIATEIANQESALAKENINSAQEPNQDVSINIDKAANDSSHTHIYLPSSSYIERSQSDLILPDNFDLQGASQLTQNSMSNFKEELGVWSLEHEITQVALEDLFKILNDNYYVCIPFRLHTLSSRRYRCLKQ